MSKQLKIFFETTCST